MGAAKPAFDRYDAAFLVGCAIFLYANLFASPGTPFLLGGDQVFFWMDAQRLLNGEQVYRDFFQFTPPGADLLYLGVFKLFGPRIWTTNAVVFTLGLALCVLCLRISKLIMPRAQAFLATSLYLVIVIGMTLDGTHHWFSLMVVMSAVAVLMRDTSPSRIAFAGALLGLATFITQTRGPVAALGIVAWMLWGRFRTVKPWSIYLRSQGLLFVPLILTWTVLSGYYIATVGLQKLWYCQVTYVLGYKISEWEPLPVAFLHGFSRAALLSLARWVFAYVVLPSVYAISLWRCLKMSRGSPSNSATRLALLVIVGIAMFLEISQSASWFRFYCVCMPGVILAAWLLMGPGKISVHATRVLWVAVIGLAGYLTWSAHVHQPAIEDLPAGRVATSPLAGEKLAWLASHTKPGQFMLQAGWPGMYLPLALRNPIFVEDLAFHGADELGYLALSIRQLEAKRVHYIVWSPRLQSPPYSIATFHEYLVDHYQRIWKFADQDEVWERKAENPGPEIAHGQPD